nr:carbohydrate kinase [Arthrobacter tumbae]
MGESLVDIVHHGTGTTERPGGSPLNVAVGSARLGIPTTLITSFAADAHGTIISTHLTDNGVGVIEGGTSPTSTATARIDASGAARYEFSLEWDISAGMDSAARLRAQHWHAGSIAAFISPGRDDVRSLITAARHVSTISFDPNCRPTITPDRISAGQTVEELVALSDIVKASDEDIAWLYPHLDMEEVVALWLHMGASLIVITRGASGSIAATKTTGAASPAQPTQVVDTVGAGESFMAALLAGLQRAGALGQSNRGRITALDTDELETLLSYASTAAAITCSRQGANPPTISELQKMRNAASRSLSQDASASIPRSNTP